MFLISIFFFITHLNENDKKCLQQKYNKIIDLFFKFTREHRLKKVKN